jgi:hypothetical protein
MKTRFAVTRLTILLFCAMSVLVSAQTSTDIKLEGPWILYVDTTLASWPLLVAVSPGGVVNENDDTYFHTMSMSAGDGYAIDSPGVYCLTFGAVCGKQGSKLLAMGNYPHKVLPLGVKKPASWDWPSKSASPYYATTFILPMPKSYSTDGGWHMKFATKFDSGGKGYSKSEQHSIGVQLHYDNGPDYFALTNCPISNFKFGDCKVMPPMNNSVIQNTGTLSIVMKSPDNRNACDPHVRRAYPKMLELLGPGTNPDKAVIDLAKGSKSPGTPIYDTDQDLYRCLDHDIQGGGSAAATPMMMSEPTQTWQSQLHSIASFYNNPDHPDPRLVDKDLLLIDIKAAIDGLDSKLPRISQLTLIEQLVRMSEARAEAILLKVDKKALDCKDAKSDLEQLGCVEKQYYANPPTKSGNDCKAPIMVAGP